MDSYSSPKITESNISNVRKLIELKQSSDPYLVSNTYVKNITTDMDHFPYTRWYRGVYYYPDSIVMEREAGYRQENNQCYTPVYVSEPSKNPDLCFQSACSTRYPCHHKYLQKNSDKEFLDSLLNYNCVNSYR